MTFLGMFFASLLALYVGVGVPIAIGVDLGGRRVSKRNKIRKEFIDDFRSKLSA